MALTKAKSGVISLSNSSKTANYSVSLVDDLLYGDSSGGAFTFTMPTEASASGRVFTFQKTSSDLTAIDIDDDGGTLIAQLHTEGETVKIHTDGTNWFILDRHIPREWTSYTVTVTGSTSNPTDGAPSTNRAAWSRDGADILINYDFIQTDATGAAVGSGTYLFSLPSGVTADTTARPAFTGSLAGNVGSASGFWDGVPYAGSIVLYNSTNFSIILGNSSNNPAYVASGYLHFNSSNMAYSASLRIPVSGWSD